MTQTWEEAVDEFNYGRRDVVTIASFFGLKFGTCSSCNEIADGSLQFNDFVANSTIRNYLTVPQQKRLQKLEAANWWIGLWINPATSLASIIVQEEDQPHPITLARLVLSAKIIGRTRVVWK